MKKGTVKLSAKGLFSRGIGTVAVLALLAGAAACSVITDFDESRIKTNLHEVLFSEDITLTTEADVGYLNLEFAERFNADEVEMLEELVGVEIQMDLGPLARSTEGRQITQERVLETPANRGEYRLLLGSGGYRAKVTFYNGPADDPIVSPGEKVRLVIYADENPVVAADKYAYEFTVEQNDLPEI